MPERRRKAASIGFMLVWTTFWLSGMVVVVYMLGRAARAGEVAAIIFMVAWLGAAFLGLRAAALRLFDLLTGDRHPGARRRASVPRRHDWYDGLPEHRDH